MTNNVDVSEKLAAALVMMREQIGKSQAQLARDSRITQAELCRFESGARTPNVAMLCKLAGGLGGMTASQLLKEAGL